MQNDRNYGSGKGRVKKGEESGGERDHKQNFQALICLINLLMKRHRKMSTDVCHDYRKKVIVFLIHFRLQVVLALLFKQTAIR
jgi:hypothetical protein